eukprot:SM000004S15128  [mRNA]  locus=s4:1378532:1379919:- [translate_table: standard]
MYLQSDEELRAKEEEVTCPVDCVVDVRSRAQFEHILREAEDARELVVVDFYNSSCGACKYINNLFVRMCKRGCGEVCVADDGEGVNVRFVKHNVRDDYDDLSDLAKFYCIRSVPTFSFFMDGSRVEQFATRDRRRLEAAIARLVPRYYDITYSTHSMDRSVNDALSSDPTSKS